MECSINQRLPAFVLACCLPVAAALAGDDRATKPIHTHTHATVNAMTGIRVAGTPVIADARKLRQLDKSRLAPLDLTTAPATSQTCSVDFNDSDALAFSEPSLWFDRIYVPWYQSCQTPAGHYIDVRPINQNHFHLGFEDHDVLPCGAHAQYYPSHIDDNGDCHPVDIPSEPRTSWHSHNGSDVARVRVVIGWNPVPFNFDQIRVTGNSAIRLCYRPVQETDPSEWEAAEPGNGAPPGVWLCWNHLDVGLWDLSAWATDVTEVRIDEAEGEGSYGFDDIAVSF